MLTVLLTLHILLCVALVCIVLLQQGKGADLGATLSGGSESLFGASGATDFITKLTTGLAIAFMVTSVLLVRFYNTAASAGAPGASGAVDPLQGSVFSGMEEVQPTPEGGNGAAVVTTTVTPSASVPSDGTVPAAETPAPLETSPAGTESVPGSGSVVDEGSGPTPAAAAEPEAQAGGESAESTGTNSTPSAASVTPSSVATVPPSGTSGS